MDGRGGCCIARYAAAGGHAPPYDMSQMDRIMLKFRPIAPKPAAAGGATPAASDGGSDTHGKASAGGRGRRKCAGKDGSSAARNRKRKSSSPEQTAIIRHDLKGVTTLPLLPEAPDLSPTKQHPNKTPEVADNYGYTQIRSRVSLDPTVTISPRHHHQPQTAVESCVIVEAVTDTCPVEGVKVGDVRALEKDTCPVIISDSWNYNVVWANEAYRRMVMVGDTWRDRKMGVWVVMKEKVPDSVQAFTCRVRVQISNDGKESRGSSSLTLPCDVWRIDGGGFAWRLDVDAALCLGR